MRKLTRKQWMKAIDTWMGQERYATQDWATTVALEGGYGKTKIKSVEEAMQPEAEGTWPGIWFQSHQTDYTVYARHNYVYSLLFGRLISGGSIRIIADHIPTLGLRQPVLFDWGGSIFTSHDLWCYLEGKIDHIVMVNLESPQIKFAKWWLTGLADCLRLAHVVDGEDSPFLYGGISVLDEGRAPEALPDLYPDEKPIVIFSEVLEHLQECQETILALKLLGIKHFYFASSFCTPAYGHHIPILIDGQNCFTPRQANARFKETMAYHGITLTKVPGWNSRVYYGEVKG